MIFRRNSDFSYRSAEVRSLPRSLTLTTSAKLLQFPCFLIHNLAETGRTAKQSSSLFCGPTAAPCPGEQADWGLPGLLQTCPQTATRESALGLNPHITVTTTAPTTILKARVDPCCGALLNFPMEGALQSPGQTLTDEQHTCFLGLNETFGVTLPSLQGLTCPARPLSSTPGC